MSNYPDYSWGYDGMTRDVMVEKMTDCQGWKRVHGSDCGSGSTKAASKQARKFLGDVIRTEGIHSIADVGAGQQVMALDLPSSVEYTPYDLVPLSDDVIEFDCTKDVLPEGHDLIICRFVLNHLSVRLAQKALMNFAESGAAFLLMTMCNNQRAYWQEHDFRMPVPLVSFPGEYNKWVLELHQLAPLDAAA